MGEYYDEESGLYYLRARYYDPSIGRFITEDPYEGSITNPLSLNLYTYCENNPIVYTDPSGYVKQSDSRELVMLIQPYTDAWKKAHEAGDAVGMKEAEKAADAIRVSYYGRNNLPDDVKYRWDNWEMYQESLYGSAREDVLTTDLVISAFALGYGGIKTGVKYGFDLTGKSALKSTVKDIKPPGWNKNWQWRYPEGEGLSTPRWFDPNGGEWRWHAPDRWHPKGHWDYNPWTEWNSKWQNIYID